MIMNRLKRFLPRSASSANEVVIPVKGNLGSLITDQMYHGVSPSQSTLVSGEFDDEDSFDVDPACDMNTDRFDYNPASTKFVTPDVESTTKD